MPDEKKFSELTTAATLTNDDILALSQIQGGALTSVKATLYAIAVHITKLAQYTSDLQTTDKTIIGAINELKSLIALIPGFNIVKVNSLPTEDIDTHTLYLVPSQNPEAQNSCDEYINTDGTTAGWELVGSTNIDLSDYYTKLEVDGLLADKLEADDFEASQTASANPITLETKQAGLAESCVVEMNPIQDLHGYEYPWAGGAGKNKLCLTIRSASTVSGVTSEVKADNNIVASGTAGTNADIICYLDTPSTLISGNTYTFSLSGTDTRGGAIYLFVGTPDVNVGTITINEHSLSFTPSADIYMDKIRLRMNSGSVNINAKAMLESGSTLHAYEPYSNICPISGRTEVGLQVNHKNILNLYDFFDGASDLYDINSNGTLTVKGRDSSRAWTLIPSKTLPAGTYTFSKSPTSGNWEVRVNNSTNYTITESQTFTFTEPTVIQMKCGLNATYPITYQLQVEKGSEATEWVSPFAMDITHQYSETIYGGVDDFVNGGATSEQGKLVLDGTENWTADTARNGVYYLFNTMASSTYADCVCDRFKTIKSNAEMQSLGIAFGIQNKAIYIPRLFDGAISGVTDVASWKTYLSNNNMEITYPLSTPTTIQLSPEALTLLKGLNVISTDGDKVQVEFSDIPVGDYSVLLDYMKSLEARIQTLEGGGNRTLALTKNISQEEKNDIIKEEPEELELEKGQEEEKEETTEEKTDEEPETSAESK